MVEISCGAALGLALGYLLGSIPFGIVLTRLAGAGDLRSIGSGNIGATNVLRTGRKGLAAATLVLDALKATLAVLLAAWAFGPSSALAAAAGAILGHLYPVWLKFRGGKGVATFLGGLHRTRLAGGDRLCGRLARGRRRHAPLFGRRARSNGGLAACRAPDRPSRGRGRLLGARRARLVKAQRQYRSPPPRRRAEDRPGVADGDKAQSPDVH